MDQFNDANVQTAHWHELPQDIIDVLEAQYAESQITEEDLIAMERYAAAAGLVDRPVPVRTPAQELACKLRREAVAIGLKRKLLDRMGRTSGSLSPSLPRGATTSDEHRAA